MIHDHQFAAARKPGANSAARAYLGDEADAVRRVLPMVRRLAWHVQGSGRDGIELEDLMQAGLLALTECVRNHSGATDDGFAAYAKMRVRGAMIDLVRRHLPLSRGAVERRKLIRHKETALRLELGREPDAGELAAGLGITLTELAELRSTSEPLRFETLDDTYSDSDPAFADDRPDSLMLLEDKEMRETLGSAIASLPQRLQVVVQLYFVEELNLAEIAQVIEVSVPRVHQLKAQALEKLKAAVGEHYDISAA
ncbi:MAG: sigma-70 family polymerase sigma factor [Novosphingobium sp.]|nr:sigma-70 family polymerase sigma factor [Novosphingobium sp.]